jgi:hypothetical protein
LIVRQAGHRTQRNRCQAATAEPIVGENSMGIGLAWPSVRAPARHVIAAIYALVPRQKVIPPIVLPRVPEIGNLDR